MTANQDRLQRLIVEINTVLAQAPSPLPWKTAAQSARQRQLLEAARSYLQTALIEKNQSESFNSVDQDTEETSAQETMQAVVQEMNALRSTLLHPLHAEVATLMQQRNTLVREIHQLEAHRQLTEHEAPIPTPDPAETLQADDALKTIDTALSVMVQSLQKDIQAYQDSLSQGIGEMHRLGYQSEALFSRLVERLVQHSRQDATFVQSDSLPPLSPALAAMPYAGTEFAALPNVLDSSSSLDSIQQLTELIDQLSIEAEPVTLATLPPQFEDATTLNSSSGLEALTELQMLFQASETIQTASVETTRDQVDRALDPNRSSL